MSRAAFILDLGRCVGCRACELACRLENDLPKGVIWRHVLPLNLGRSAGGPTYHFSLACHHCEQPACMAACPAGAYRKRPDGVILLQESRCLGCRYCEMACCFGAPSYDAGAGVMTKCNLCANRIDKGLQPACVAACPTQALLFCRSDDWADDNRRQYEISRIPGFSDAAGCRPAIRFLAPRGRIRKRTLLLLEEGLKR